MSMNCKYGGPCGGCMACQDARIYYPEEEPEEEQEEFDNE